MDVLKWLALLPVRLIKLCAKLVALLLSPLFGRISWQAPGWLPALARTTQSHPRASISTLAVAVVVALGGWFGWQWYAHRPQPVYTRVSILAPAVTDYDRKDDKPPLVHPLVVKFSNSAAPIERVDKSITQGISINPAVKGTWQWVNDTTLRFTPAADWPVGRRYTLRLDAPKLLAPQVHINKDKFSFNTVAFAAQLGDGQFYQNPQDARVKQVIQELTFNYPVDPATLEKRIHLAIANQDGKPGQAVKFSVRYDKHKLHAWVRSAQLALPHDPGKLLVRVENGIRSARGGDGTPATLNNEVRIPGLYSLHLATLEPTVADADSNQPQQVLLADFNAAVTAKQLGEHIQAWLLPKRKTGTHASEAEPYQWSADEIGDQLLQTSQQLVLTANPTVHAWQSLQSFKFSAEPGRQIYVRLSAGLTSFGGYVMAKPVVRVLTVPDYPQQLNFAGSGSLLTLKGDHRISVASRNLPGFRMVIGRVRPEQLSHLASLNQGTYAHPDLGYSLDENQLVDRFEFTRALSNTKPGTVVYSAVDLGQYFTPDKHGVFWLHLSGFNPEAAQKQARKRAASCAKAQQQLAHPTSPAGIAACQPANNDGGSMDSAPSDSRLIVLTDLGLLVKRDQNGEQQVFVQSISTGEPVADAQVDVVAINGKVLLSQHTTTDGMVTFPSLAHYRQDEKPAMYRVTKADDMSFLPIGADDRQLDYSRYDVGGAENPVNPSRLTSDLFSDRGLYRPGEKIHIGIIVRAASWTRDVAGIPLEARVIDPRNRTVKTIPLSMDDTGFAAIDYQLAQTAPTGTWRVNLYIAGKDENAAYIGSTTVQVKEFQPDRMKVKTTLSRSVADGWIKPDQLKALVTANNLFGTPATQRRVTASVTLQPAYPNFKAWPDWNFYDPHSARKSYEYTLQDGRTDAKGQASFPLDLARFDGATYRLAFLAQVYEPDSGHSVAAVARAMVSSNGWLIGYHTDDSLSYVTRGSTRNVKLVAIDPQTKSIAVGPLTAQLVERKYVSILTKQPSGVYKYESHLKIVPVHSTSLSIPAGGTQLALDTTQPGDYELLIKNPGGDTLNKIAYTVAGAANVSRSLDRNAELQLTLDHKVYHPGDTISVSIHAPYTGSGLITLERDKVYAHVWFHSDTTSSVQHITIPADFQGNGYVDVQFVRSSSSDKIYMSPLSYGVVPFRLSHDQHREKLQVTTPELVKPGQTAHFNVQVGEPAKVVVFAVDEGILQVARYQLKDPLDYFFRKRQLDVQTAQILDLILPEFAQLVGNASTPGGDEAPAPALIASHLNPFQRKHSKPAVYWSGVVAVNGSKTFDYKVPDDFNGKLRVMAVAVAPGRIGTWQGETTVRGDFVLSPNAPTTLAPGDEALVGVGVANNLTDIGKQAVPVAVSVKPGEGFSIVGPATQSVTLASMKEGHVSFRVKATDHLGAADLTFTAHYGTHESQLSTSTSVRPATTYRVSLDTAQVAAGATNSFDGVRSLYVPFAQRNAVMSSSPVVLARGLTSYLINYPNYCTEQLVSAAMPRLIVAHWPAAQAFIPALQPAFADTPITNQDALAHFMATIQARQNGQGGFGVWAATPDANPFISDYAMQFLLIAQARGVPVPQDLINAGNSYLRGLARNDGLDSLPELRDRAYAIYLLTSQHQITTNLLAAVQKRLEARYPKVWKDDLAAAWLAASYKLLHMDAMADQLIAGPEKELIRHTEAARDFSFANYYGPTVRDTFTLYLLSTHFPQRARELPADALENIARPLEHNHYNTLSAATTLLALDAYASADHKGLAQMHIEALAAGGNVKPEPIGEVSGQILQATSWPTDTVGLKFVNDSQWPAWRVVTQSGYDRTPPKTAIKNGLEIIRDYTDAKGKPVTRVALGQEVTVHIKIRATDGHPVDNVAIEDLLPGGFEPVLRNHPAAKQAAWASPIGLDSSTWSPSFADVREDRVVIYGTAPADVKEFQYKIRAVNAGTFHIPPVYASAMYQPQIQAEAPGQGTLTVTEPTTTQTTQTPAKP